VTQFDLGPGVKQLSELLAGVTDEQLGDPTPCPAYSAGDLVDHIGGLALAFAASAQKARNELVEGAPAGSAARLTDDWRTRIPRDLETLAEAWRDPRAWSGTTRIAAQDAPAEMVGLTVADELVVHGWDLARATGQPYDAEPELVNAARTFLNYFASPDAPAGDDVAFGPSRTAPPNASPLDEVLALAGRDVTWMPRT
jgi:uncharacterized protein (TIGR03086 family)